MVYLVWAQSGSDYTDDLEDHLVCAYLIRDLAEEHVRLANHWARKIDRICDVWQRVRLNADSWKPGTYVNAWGHIAAGSNPYDHAMLRWRTFYEVLEIPLLTTVQKISGRDKERDFL